MADYTFDSYGRFDTLTTGGDMGTHVVDYSYVTASSLLAGYTVDGTNTDHFSFSKGWRADRNLVASTSTTWGAANTVYAGYDYAYDDMNRRMTAVQTGTAFDDYGVDTHRRYDYNQRSELIGDYSYANDNATATTPTDGMADRAFEFAFDDIGSRITSNRTGNPGLAESYTRNELNQYTSRSHDTLTASGTVANSTTTVAARIKNDSKGAGGPWVVADRAANYWSTALVPRNATHATKDTVDVVAVDAGAGTSGSPHLVDGDDTRSTMLPTSGVNISYDDDGNITNDGLWQYAWDAENRLVYMETSVWAYYYGGADLIKLTFSYDHLHRRVRKQRHEYSEISGVYEELSDRRFTYDGWNVILEEEVTPTTPTTRTYAWGLDIKGSLQGAAGVSGLVALHDEIENPSGKLLLPGYDSNGNVAVMVNGANGNLEAAYEYGPFGEALRIEGTSAKLNPFRFSTKYTDDETGWVYYGRRYYDPKDGRFVGRDPIEEQGGINLYAFVANNTVNSWDYAGMTGSRDYRVGEGPGDMVHNFYEKRENMKSEFDNVTTEIRSYSSTVGPRKKGGISIDIIDAGNNDINIQDGEFSETFGWLLNGGGGPTESDSSELAKYGAAGLKGAYAFAGVITSKGTFEDPGSVAHPNAGFSADGFSSSEQNENNRIFDLYQGAVPLSAASVVYNDFGRLKNSFDTVTVYANTMAAAGPLSLLVPLAAEAGLASYTYANVLANAARAQGAVGGAAPAFELANGVVRGGALWMNAGARAGVMTVEGAATLTGTAASQTAGRFLLMGGALAGAAEFGLGAISSLAGGDGQFPGSAAQMGGDILVNPEKIIPGGG